MKNIKFYSTVTLVLAAFIYAQYAVAQPVAVQPSFLYMSPAAIQVEPEEDDHDDPDHGYECELIFPFCEANIV